MAEGGQFGLSAGRFGFTLAGVAGSSVLVEASEDLGLANWTPLSTNILSAQRRAQFIDPAPADRPGRFYRVRVP